MADAKDFPDLIPEGDSLLGHSYRHYYEGAYYHLLFPDWPSGYNRDTEPAVYLEDKEKREHRRVKDAALSEAIRKDYWRDIDIAVSHPLPDGPGPTFLRDLQEQAKKLAATNGFPEVIRQQDPLMVHSCGHWYSQVYYHLLWPNWPAGYGRETVPAVYTLDEAKGEYRAVKDEGLREAIAAHYWQEIDEQNARMMTMPGPMRRTGPMGAQGMIQTGFTGMMDGSYMTPQPPQSAPVSAAWTCPSCGKAGNQSRFCPECGAPKPEKGEGWTCPLCGTEGNTGNFCPGCGGARPEGT